MEKAKKLEASLKRAKAQEKVRQLQQQAQRVLPLNRELMASNVVEGDVPLEAVASALRLYKEAVEPYLEPERQDAQARWRASLDGAELNFFCLSPSAKKWKYHIDWVYPDDLATRGVMAQLFEALGVQRWFTRGDPAQIEGMEIDTEEEVTMYAASFVVRTGAKQEPFWHTDYEWFFGAEGEAALARIRVGLGLGLEEATPHLEHTRLTRTNRIGRTTPIERRRASRRIP